MQSNLHFRYLSKKVTTINRILILFIFCLIIILNSCSKDTNTNLCQNCVPDSDNYIFARMNGQPWHPDLIQSSTISYLASGMRNFIFSPFKDSVGIYLSASDWIHDEQYPVPITYSDSTRPILVLFYGVMHRSDSLISYTSKMVSGHMTISSQNISAGKISGSFEFTVVDTLRGTNDTIKITNGTFTNLHYYYH